MQLSEEEIRRMRFNLGMWRQEEGERKRRNRAVSKEERRKWEREVAVRGEESREELEDILARLESRKGEGWESERERVWLWVMWLRRRYWVLWGEYPKRGGRFGVEELGRELEEWLAIREQGLEIRR